MVGVVGIPGDPMEELITGKGDPRLLIGEFTDDAIPVSIMEEGWQCGGE